MKNTDDAINQTISSGDLEWVLLGEFSSRDFVQGQGEEGIPSTGRMQKILCEVGLSPGLIEKINAAFSRFARDMLASAPQGRLVSTGSIRVFCPRRMISEATGIRPEKPDIGGQAQIVGASAALQNVGWGCYAIERGGNLDTHRQESGRVVELYLYQEGK